jgi:glycosyltransferase involved in cell wall biosynthesis
MKFRLLLIKRAVEDVIMFPLILLGRLLAIMKPLGREYKVFYFFPFYHTGGAEKVHALIAKATGNSDCIIYFTKKSHNASFFQKFKETGCCIKDVSKYTDNKWIYFTNIIFRGIISGFINKQKTIPVVFNGQCNFGYKISPWINKNTRQIELIHSVSNFSYIRIPFLPFITETVMISIEKIKEHKKLYHRFSIPGLYDAKIHHIPNTSEFDNIESTEKDFSKIIVMYSGRATYEKRANLIVAIAKKVHEENKDIQFIMAGDEFNKLKSSDNSFISFKGNIADEKELHAVYKQSNVLLITSSTEGFPLAVIEGMAYGNAIIATPVGDLPVHIKDSQNGYLFSSVQDENKIIEEGCALILRLDKEKQLLKQIAVNNISYAQEHFSFKKFAGAYNKIIFN